MNAQPGELVPMGQWFAAYMQAAIMNPAKNAKEGEQRVHLTFMALRVDQLWLENQELRARIAELESRP